MRNLKLLLPILMIGLLFMTACEEKEVFESQPELSLDSIVVQADLSYKVIDGVLTFKSGEGYFVLSNRLNKMSGEEYNSWSDSVGLVSYYTGELKANEELNNATKEADFNNIVFSYQNFFTYDYETKSVYPLINDPAFKKVSNLDGIFKVGQTFHKIVPGETLYTKAENASSAMQKFNSDDDISRINPIVSSNNLDTRKGWDIDYPEYTPYSYGRYNNNLVSCYPGTCGRYLYFTMQVHMVAVVECAHVTKYQHQIRVEMFTRGYNFAGGWYNKPSALHWDNVKFKINMRYKTGLMISAGIASDGQPIYYEELAQYGTEEEILVPDYNTSGSDESNHSYEEYVGTTYQNINPYFDWSSEGIQEDGTGFIRIYGEAWSRGTSSSHKAIIWVGYNPIPSNYNSFPSFYGYDWEPGASILCK